ncbi:hypothetical protein NAMH_1375 [Nautilia profundicola AmH]|uniref:Transformation system protein n=1 Tax=Nautilia profundicola (strain ATCC BAA-1463 / DSM 18972 / AmH) TaxID=598659 RepID=B9L5Y0_NAUPA|nr:hypothetical protein [Nautilia profundicola]ACM92103.1 hypothetical protein NAMH_1375 [Nautilia profundicola AmH]
MKKLIIFVILITLNADIYTVITEIKKMQTYTPNFKKIEKYNIFSSFNIVNKNIPLEITAQDKILSLNAIFQNKADINGVWVKVGDEIAGYKVIKINNNEVVLKKNNTIKKLVLKSNILKVVK